MRKLMWFTIGFVVACAAAVYLYCGNWLLLFSLLCASGGFVMLAFRHSQSCRCMALLFAGCAAAFFWVWMYHGFYLSQARSVDGETFQATIEITDYSNATDYGIAADGKIYLNEKPYKVRVYSYDVEKLEPGDRIWGTMRLQFTANPEDEIRHHSGSGIFLLAYLKDDTVVTQAGKLRLRDYPAFLRAKITELLGSTFPTDTLPFAQALLLGDRSLLGYKTNSDLSISGIRHVVAVSGLHVSILLSVLYGMFGHRRFITPIIGWAILIVFAAVTGFSPSVVRACLMHALMLGGLMLLKEYDGPTALSFAVLVMLLVNPMAATSVGLQLSAGCVVGMFLFAESIQNFILSDKCIGKATGKSRRAKIKRWLAGSVSVTISMLITTTPLCAVYFKTISLIGVITNLLTLWIITFIFCGLLIVCVTAAVYLPLGRIVAWTLSWAIRYVLLIAKWMASFPLAAVYTRSIYIVAWIVCCYALLAAFLLLKKKRPWLLTACITGSLVIAVFLSWNEPKENAFQFAVLDVGQGQCILIQKEDAWYMVDCGGDNPEQAADMAAAELLSQGITELDGLILTHYDEDHSAGAEMLMTRIPIKKLYLPAFSDSGKIKQTLSEHYAEKICWIGESEARTITDAAITIFAGSKEKSDNERSLCVLFQPENCDILITGDRSIAGERTLLEQTDLPDLEVLMVGHHGAKDSCGLELLQATRPEMAIISVSENNHFGHPAEEVLERLALFGCEVWRTDLNGTIIIRR